MEIALTSAADFLTLNDKLKPLEAYYKELKSNTFSPDLYVF